MKRLWIAFCVFAIPISFLGCESVGGKAIGPTTGPTSTPTGSPSPSPAPCGTPDSLNANLVVVGMATGFAPVVDPTYASIGGYAVVDITGGSAAPVYASPINQTASGAPITTQNTIQFANLEPASSIVHSAVGFTGSAFPAKPFTFPTPLASPTASAISTAAPWSTGLIAAPAQALCYSQEFRLSAGTYYFGDYTYYNITTFQDVLVVTP